MKYVQKFDTQEEYEEYIKNNASKLNTKMMYVNQEEQMHIGSGTTDIVIDMHDLNASLQGLNTYYITTSKSQHVYISMPASRLEEGYTGYIATITAETDYIIDEENSVIYMNDVDGDPVKMNHGTDYTFDGTGKLYLNTALHGNVILEYIAIPQASLEENEMHVWFKGGKYTEYTDWETITELEAGISYDIKISTSAGQTEETANVAISVSNTTISKYENSLLKVFGNNGEGGSTILTIYAAKSGNYLPITKQQSYQVVLQTPTLNWTIDKTVKAGTTIDLSTLTANSGGNITITTRTTGNVVSNITTADIDKKYETQGNGTGGLIIFSIQVSGTNNYVSSVIEKSVSVELLDNKIDWAFPVTDAEHDYATFKWYTTRTYELSITATYGIESVVYTIDNTTYGTVSGSTVTIHSNGKNATTRITASIAANGNYRAASKSQTINITLIEPVVSWAVTNGYELTAGQSESFAISSKDTNGAVVYQKYTNAYIFDGISKTTNNKTYNINSSTGVLTMNTSADTTDNTIFIIKASIQANGDYSAWEDYRYIIVKLVQNSITWSRATTLPAGDESEKTATPKYPNGNNKITSITLYNSNETGEQLSEYTTNPYEVVVNGDGLSFIITTSKAEIGNYILAIAHSDAFQIYAACDSTRNYHVTSE